MIVIFYYELIFNICLKDICILIRFMLQVNEIGSPYGDCRDDYTAVQLSRCLSNCESDYMVHICGCVDVYINNSSRKHFFVYSILINLIGARSREG